MAPPLLNGLKDVSITEDEAALYDRQIRLWGFDAQQRMRNSTVLVIRLKGVATEAIKNIVLAGIGTLKLLDDSLVEEEDLGAGFFFREDDVGKKKVDAAVPRIASLNPLVNIVSVSSPLDLSSEALDALLSNVDMVCVTDFDRATMYQLDGACRRLGKLFYAGGSYGLFGYVFCDLLQHSYLSTERNPTKGDQQSKKTLTYAPLQEALKHKWSSLNKRQTKELNPGVVFSILALWEYQARHHGALPEDATTADELEKIANNLLAAASVNTVTIKAVPKDYVERLATTAPYELSPVCAVVGGLMAQDMLKALGGREAPIANLFTFDGMLGGGTVSRLAMTEAV